MFKRIVSSLSVASFALSLSAVAAAHSPPSLVQRQAAAAHAVQSSGGYRDIHARFGDVALRAPTVMKTAGGYRDIAHRFPGHS
jgi:hypothetical protein